MLEELSEVVTAAKISPDRYRAAAGRPNLLAELFGLGGGTIVVDRDRPAVRREAPYQFRAKSHAATGDEGIATAIRRTRHVRTR